MFLHGFPKFLQMFPKFLHGFPMLAHEGPQEHTCDPLMTLRGAHVILIFNHYHRRDIRDAETAVADAICIIPECECGRLWRLRKPFLHDVEGAMCQATVWVIPGARTHVNARDRRDVVLGQLVIRRLESAHARSEEEGRPQL